MNGSELAMSEWEYLLNNNLELKFIYTNYKNDIRERYVGSPMAIEFMVGDKRFYNNNNNNKPKFFLRAFDLEKQEYRDFSLERMIIDPTQKEF